MQLIQAIKIRGFRSCRNVALNNISDYTVLVGANNAGKSNILKALNMFFTGNIGEGSLLDIRRDVNVPGNQKKECSVEVKFKLPKNFNFHKNLGHRITELFSARDESTNRVLWIRKRWRLDPTTEIPSEEIHFKKQDNEDYPEVSSTDYGGKADMLETTRSIQKFLSLINLTYIPSHRDPGLLIRNASNKVRKLLSNKYKHRIKTQEELFSEMIGGATELIEPLVKRIRAIFPDIQNVSIKTPSDLAELALVLGYTAHTQTGEKLNFNLQGSGLQTQLMFLVQEMADTAYRLEFGWKQATVWCLEEPESFLHFNLEGNLANYFRSIVEDEHKKIQIISSTHSEIITLHASNGYYLSRSPEHGYTVASEMEPADLVNKAYSAGITSLIHALALYKYTPLVLVEGISDQIIFNKAAQLLNLHPVGTVTCLSELERNPELGGCRTIYDYLKQHKKIVKERPPEARLTVVWDPDNKNSQANMNDFFSRHHPTSYCHVLKDTHRNPELDPNTFRGIEQFLSTRLIEFGHEAGIMALAEPRKKGVVKYVLQNTTEFKKRRREFAELVEKRGTKEDFKSLEQELSTIKLLSEGKKGEALRLFPEE